jgi:hypothetical protein
LDKTEEFVEDQDMKNFDYATAEPEEKVEVV